MCLSSLTIPQTVFGPAVKLHAHKDVTLRVMELQVCCVWHYLFYLQHIFIFSLCGYNKVNSKKGTQRKILITNKILKQIYLFI